MEISVVAETEQIELQRLGFHHLHIGHVTDADFGKVRLARDRAKRGEFRAVETHPVIIFSMPVFKGFQHLGGIFLAVISIILIHTDKSGTADGPYKWLLPILLVCGGAADSMANVFDNIGDPAVKDYFLFYTFAAAMVCSLVLMLARHERIGRQELLDGILIGIPNYFSARFLLLSLGRIPAVIVYPVVSVGTIILVSFSGLLLFHERLSRRKLFALGIILLAILFLNI